MGSCFRSDDNNKLMVATNSALALPDQDQAESSERRAISGPLDLPDHEARCRPGDHAGALTDPQKPQGKREKAYDQKHCAHGLFPRWRSGGRGYRATVATVARSMRKGKCRHRTIERTKKPRTTPGLLSC